MITGKTYKWLKFVALIALPALGTLYFTLAQIWGLPVGAQVVGTIVAIDTFLGVLLGISQKNFKKQIASGVMNVAENERGKTFQLELDNDPHDLDQKKEVRLKVIPNTKGRRGYTSSSETN